MEAVVLVGEGAGAAQAEEELLVAAVHDVLGVQGDRAPPHLVLQRPHQGGHLVLGEGRAQKTQLLQLGQIFYEAFEKYWFLQLDIVQTNCFDILQTFKAFLQFYGSGLCIVKFNLPIHHF